VRGDYGRTAEPALSTETIHAEHESEICKHSRKLYGRECYCSLHITSQALYAREFSCHRPPLQIIRAEPDIDFFAPTLSKVIWLRVLLLTPHHLQRCTLESSRAPPPSTHPLATITAIALSPLSPSCHSSAMARTKQNAKKSTGGRATPASWAGPYQSNPRHPHSPKARP